MSDMKRCPCPRCATPQELLIFRLHWALVDAAPMEWCDHADDCKCFICKALAESERVMGEEFFVPSDPDGPECKETVPVLSE